MSFGWKPGCKQLIADSMKIYPDKLVADLKTRMHKLYIVSGDEQLLVQETTDLIRRALRARGFFERELFHAEASFDWNTLLQSAGSLSLFAEKKLLEVRLPSGKPGDQGGKMLTQLLEQLDEDNVLLLVLPRAGQDIQRTRWFKSLEAFGVFIQIWPIEAKDLPRWLGNRCKQAGLTVTQDALRLMAERVEGNLLAAVQEVERLRLTVADGRVDLQEVTEGVADSARYDVFKLLDNAMAGNSVKCVRMIRGLKAEGIEIMYIISMLARELRSLEKMASDLALGQSRQVVFKQARVWKNREAFVSRCLERHSSAALRAMIASIGHIDRMVKGLEAGDPWRVLQNIFLHLSGSEVIKSARVV